MNDQEHIWFFLLLLSCVLFVLGIIAVADRKLYMTFIFCSLSFFEFAWLTKNNPWTDKPNVFNNGGDVI